MEEEHKYKYPENDIRRLIAKEISYGNKYDIIYADPPWRYTTRSSKGLGKSAEKHYEVMSMEDIDRLPVSEIASDNAVLFMWVTDPLLPRQLLTIERWGFTYKTVGFTWRKLTKHGKDFIGLGYYTRSNPEMCLIATRGKPLKVDSHSIRQLISHEAREHSRKPDEVYDCIEQLYPDKSYIELFARNTPRKNWVKLGNEVGKHV